MKMILLILAAVSLPLASSAHDETPGAVADPARNTFAPGDFEKTDDGGRPRGWDDLSAFDSGQAKIEGASTRYLRLRSNARGRTVGITARLGLQPEWKWLTVGARLRAHDIVVGESDQAGGSVSFAMTDAEGRVRRTAAVFHPATKGVYRDWAAPTRTFRVEPGDAFLVLSATLADCTGEMDVDDVLVVPFDPAAEAEPELVVEFQRAVVKGDAEAVRKMHGSERRLLEARNSHYDGGTPLIVSAWEGRADMTTLLLDLGADLNAVDRNWKAPAIGWAAFWGRPKVAEILLDAGANVNSPNGGGATPLTSAVFALEKRKSGSATDEERRAVIELLKQRGGTTKPQQKPAVK